MLEAQVWLFSELMLRLDLFDNRQVLDPNSELAVFIVSRLDGQDITWCEGYVDILLTGTDSDGPFVHVQEGSDTVSGAVAVVKAVFLSHRA